MKPKFVIALLLISLFVSACSAGATATETAPDVLPPVTDEATIIAEGRLEPVRSAEIAFTAGGMVSDVLVQEGQAVKKGETLIRLGDESDTNYAAAQLELVTAQQALNDLMNSSDEDLAQAVIDLKEAKETYDKAENYLEYLQNAKKVPQTETRLYYVQTWKGYEYRTRTKFYKGPAPEDWIVEAENDLALKKARLDETQRRYDRLKDGADVEQLALLEARLNAAEAKLATFSVVSPFDGLVADLNGEAGSSINAGEIAVTVADFSEWLVKTTDLTEIDVVALAEGQPVLVTLDAIPDAQLGGTILSIGQTYTENQGDVVYEVTIVLTDTHPAMRWGMTAAVTFQAED
jgi:HlyD family secretion protein